MWLDAIAPAWLVRPVFRWRSIRVILVAVCVSMAWAAFRWEAHAAGGSLAEQARSLIGELEADTSVRQLITPATTRAKDALSRAEAASARVPEHGMLLEAAALEWAQVARDLKRAREAEQASERLEQEVSSTQTEIVRSRASVELAMARVGRARQDLADLEAGAPKPTSPPLTPAVR